MKKIIKMINHFKFDLRDYIIDNRTHKEVNHLCWEKSGS